MHSQRVCSPALQGSGAVAETLLAAGAQHARPADKAGSQAMHLAAARGHSEVIRALAAHGANPSSWRRDGLAPIHLAAFKGHEAAICELLSTGARADSPLSREGSSHWAPYAGWNVVHIAAHRGHVGALRMLLLAPSAPSIACRSVLGETPLHLAAQAGQQAAVEALLEAGAPASALNSSVWTPLHCAALAGHLGCYLALLRAGASQEARDWRQRVPLALAAAKAGEEGFRSLLASPAVLEGLPQRHRVSVLSAALRAGHRGEWLAVLLPADNIPAEALVRWWQLSLRGTDNAVAVRQGRMAALEQLTAWGIPDHVVDRVGACCCLLN